MNWNKRDTVRTVIILCGVVLFAYVLFNFDKVSSMFSWLINILMPFVIGFAIAFVVNVPMKGLEKVLFKQTVQVQETSVPHTVVPVHNSCSHVCNNYDHT